jgi:REP element-mobilizing transposase RayT
MAIRMRHDTTYSTWFITFTCYNWIPLFEITSGYNLVYNWLKFISDKYQIKTLAFVIMPNHVHLLLQLENEAINLNTVISNGKRFMAYDLIEKLQVLKHDELLTRLSDACSVIEKGKGQKHKVFEPSFDAKAIYSDKFLNQKLGYIHHNPVSGKWNLCNDFIDYYHSSAAFYELNRLHNEVDIVNYSQYR